MTADFSAFRVDLATEADFRLGPIQVQPSTRQVEVSGVPETLEPRIMQVLVALARKQGQVVSRDELIETCWEGRIVGDDALNRCTSKIRKLGEAHGAFRLETIPRVGYRLWASEKAVEPAAAAKPDESPDQAPTAVGASQARKPGWLSRPVLAFAVALVAVLIAGGIYLGIRNSKTVVVTARSPIVAVLPFDTLGEDTPNPLARSIPGQVTSLLNDQNLQTPPPSTFVGLSRKEQEAEATKAGATLILDGVVQKEGDNVQVRVYLTDVRSNLTVWSKDYPPRPSGQDRPYAYQIASHVVEMLRCRLITHHSAAGDIPPETLTLFLNACDRIQQFEAPDPDRDKAAAREAMKKVTEAAPDFSFGWSMRAMVVAQVVQNYPPGIAELEEARKAVRTFAERALKLDPSNGEAYLALAQLVPRTGHWPEQLKLLDKAIGVQPDLSDAYACKADLLESVGEEQAAVANVRHAVSLDGLAPNHWAELVRALSFAGRLDEAHTMRENIYEKWPDAPAVKDVRIINTLMTDDPMQVLKLAKEHPEVVKDDDVQAWIDFWRARVSGDKQKEKAAVDLIGEGLRKNPSFISLAVSMDNVIGNTDEAISRLRSFYKDLPWQDTFLPFVPPTRAMLANPRIIDLFRQVGLLDYWKTKRSWWDWKSKGDWPDFCDQPNPVCDQMKAN